MTPIERAARAAYHSWISGAACGGPPWEKLPQSFTDLLIEAQRAAFLALTECELPTDAIAEGANAMISNDGVWSEDAKVCFSAILRFIAKGMEA